MSMVFFNLTDKQLKSLMLVSEDLIITDLCIDLLNAKSFNSFAKEFRKVNKSVFTEVTIKEPKESKKTKHDFAWLFEYDVRVKTATLCFGIDIVREKGKKYFSLNIHSVQPNNHIERVLSSLHISAILGIAISIGVKTNLLITMEEFKNPEEAMKALVASIGEANDKCQHLAQICRKNDLVERKDQVVTFRSARLPYL